MTRTTSLNTGLDDFLAWAAAREGAPALPERPADAVLCLLALRGADRRAGVPEPTPELVARVLGEDLPGLLWATAPETDAVPQVLYALADRVHQAGRLNAKRHLRLLEAVDAAVPAFRQAMADPARLTWHRWYASLLRADGVDPDDPSAVTAWLGGYAAAPTRAVRRCPRRSAGQRCPAGPSPPAPASPSCSSPPSPGTPARTRRGRCCPRRRSPTRGLTMRSARPWRPWPTP
ncbi:hypothetical protein ACRAR1_03755 [Streptomyces sanyensis]|uniref:hypothetical protein n=1 Tax=Streptomyces sanyensis TaxID=568869 RepID=UPI003D780B84